jgi:hypothetical protein
MDMSSQRALLSSTGCRSGTRLVVLSDLIVEWLAQALTGAAAY